MNNLTNKELEIIKLFIAESLDCCGAFDDEGENMSYMNAQDLVELTDYNAQEIGGIMSALEAKGLIQDTMDSARRLKINDFVANECTCRDYGLSEFIDTYGDEPAEENSQERRMKDLTAEIGLDQ